jgi:hypothetical protein
LSNPHVTSLRAPLVGDGYAEHIAARLRDFFEDSTPWERRLWDTGTILTLNELFEASQWCAKGVLSSGAVTWLARDLERLAGKDRGVGDRDLRMQLRDTLRSSVPCESRYHRRLLELTAFVNDSYLTRWAKAVDTNAPPSPERAARAIGSHLLDCGYSMRYLRRRRSELISNKATLGDLFDSGQTLAAGQTRRFQIVVPFLSLPQGKELATSLRNWLSAADVVQWLAANAEYPRGYRQNGGFGYAVDALDEHAAADVIRAVIDRLKARSSHGRGVGIRGPVPVGDIWILDGSVWHRTKLGATARSSYVLSLAAEKRVYDVFDPSPIDDALELAAPLNYGPPGPAVSGAWAAIEALLVTPADEEDGKQGRGTVAADRMAVTIAASWPRGELTTLSYRHSPNETDRLKTELEQVTVNRERARLVANALKSGRPLALAGVACSP